MVMTDILLLLLNYIPCSWKLFVIQSLDKTLQQGLLTLTWKTKIVIFFWAEEHWRLKRNHTIHVNSHWWLTNTYLKNSRTVWALNYSVHSIWGDKNVLMSMVLFLSQLITIPISPLILLHFISHCTIITPSSNLLLGHLAFQGNSSCLWKINK